MTILVFQNATISWLAEDPNVNLDTYDKVWFYGMVGFWILFHVLLWFVRDSFRLNWRETAQQDDSGEIWLPKKTRGTLFAHVKKGRLGNIIQVVDSQFRDLSKEVGFTS